MNVRRTRQTLWCLTGCLALAAVGALGIALRLPPPVLPSSVAPTLAKTKTQQASASRVPPLAEFMPLWSLNLRQPLFDPPPVKAAAVDKPKPPPITFKLAGLFADAAGPQAMFTLADGEIATLAIGGCIGDHTKLVEIHQDHVVLLHYGEPQTLKMEEQ